MLKKYITSLLFFVLTSTIFSQATVKLSIYSKVSIITSGPGDAIYEKFGHTAIRVKDPVLNLDILYNFGIFDFDDPNFILNFTKGYMNYKLAGYPFYLALKSAQKDKRWVKEQVLNLTQEQKNKFFYFLVDNAKPENASYLYDPFFDNCATRPRNIIQQILGDNLVFSDEFVSQPQSLRQLMNKEINPNTWGSLGINIALGSKLDKIATPNEYLYLPDYLYKALEVSKINSNSEKKPLVKQSRTLLEFNEKEAKSDVVSPFLVFLLLSLIGLFITYKDYINNTRTKWLDFILFFSTGLFGVVIVFLSFFTNHSTAPNNYNFLWAFAPNLVIAFLLLKSKLKNWIKYYVIILGVLLILIPVIWALKIQLFPLVLLPFFILLLIRYSFLYKKL
ncbi:hypothetical protein WH52_00790 [Tenacibaculum holothuriorum]|uniref:Uncharacterized protein n=1 Tax=Tenacibaculum holothuriorum TaxID=1635173 RepID=A0A1Y2PGV1_9FLAO|nr:DUF4105 domain-containing protein [Tenacibaculum holothuriorum]OSY89221.1 hypothetical protein WH52_00790 [Tenacibaculum holothuriorum]